MTAGFGGQQQQQNGTRAVQWRRTVSTDTSGGKNDGYYQSISAMPEYTGKSFEELRWEDYQVRCFCPGGLKFSNSQGTGLSAFVMLVYLWPPFLCAMFIIVSGAVVGT